MLVRRTRGHVPALANYFEGVDRLLDHFFTKEEWPLIEAEWCPSLDVSETDKAVEVKAELPGLKAEDVAVSFDNNTLTLSGEKKETSEHKDKDYYHSECRYPSSSNKT